MHCKKNRIVIGYLNCNCQSSSRWVGSPNSYSFLSTFCWVTDNMYLVCGDFMGHFGDKQGVTSFPGSMGGEKVLSLFLYDMWHGNKTKQAQGDASVTNIHLCEDTLVASRNTVWIPTRSTMTSIQASAAWDSILEWMLKDKVGYLG